MYISKTDYLEYTFCKKNLWLKKHKPELFLGVELSEFEKKIIEEGNAADKAARNLFSEGILIDFVGTSGVEITRDTLAKKPGVVFQGAFLVDDFFVQADILRFNDVLDGYELFEVKATNSVSRKVPHHHVNDLAFQKIVIEKSGLKIVRAGVIHLNGEYKMTGNQVDYRELFIIEDLTDEVLEAEEDVRAQMMHLKNYVNDTEESGCECIYKGRSAQCTTFQYSNPEVPEYSVHDLVRIGSSKRLLANWVDKGIYALEDIDDQKKLTEGKLLQYQAYIRGKPLIFHDAIAEDLNALEFPLHFFDYEGYSSAIPLFAGFGAYEQVPFQYSLHILHSDGRLEHKEFLITNPENDLTLPLIEKMRADFYDQGSVLAWHKSYESQRNSKLAELHPNHAEFLEDLNDRMYDLKEIFSKNNYVDARFKGSASIKNILPVLVPELSYKKLNVQKGDQAVERWEKLIDKNTPKEEKEQITKDLLEYCKLDTMAMVEIYNVLKGL